MCRSIARVKIASKLLAAVVRLVFQVLFIFLFLMRTSAKTMTWTKTIPRALVSFISMSSTIFFENSASEENFSMFYEYFEKPRYGTVRTIGLENYDKSRGIRYGTGQVLQIPSRAQPCCLSVNLELLLVDFKFFVS